MTIPHKYGDTTIAERPERVVTVGLSEQDALLALGVVPVATTTWIPGTDGNILPWAEEALGDAEPPEVLGSEQEFEQVAGLEPDLIVAMYSSISEKDYELYSAIAPTIAQPEDTVDYGASWQQVVATLGDALGEQQRAEQLTTEVNDAFAAARREHPELDGAVGVPLMLYEGIFVYGPEDPRVRLFSELGFTFPDDLRSVGEEEFGASISAERADLLDLDALLWFNSRDEVLDTVPTYESLDVASEARDVFVPEGDPMREAVAFSTVLSIPYVLNGLVPRLAAAVDGDPSTPTS